MNEDTTPTLEELIGKYVLIGITYLDADGNIEEQKQFHGYFESMDDVVHIRLKNDSYDFTLPPDLSAFEKADPGDYELKSTGEVVVDPEYLCFWEVNSPKDT